jgi:hypothetical protein
MSLYKRVFPYVLAAVPVAISSCVSMKSFQAKAVVKQIVDEDYYCDVDNDGLVDFKLSISDFNPEKRAMFTGYIQAGDTLNLKLPNWVLDEGKIIVSDIDSVNGRTYNDLRRLYNVNQVRTEIGQPKQR